MKKRMPTAQVLRKKLRSVPKLRKRPTRAEESADEVFDVNTSPPAVKTQPLVWEKSEQPLSSAIDGHIVVGRAKRKVRVAMYHQAFTPDKAGRDWSAMMFLPGMPGTVYDIHRVKTPEEAKAWCEAAFRWWVAQAVA